ncbi:MAG: MaoC family dehydratase N-terminal domain-containing protein [Spirochaetales bacterium]|nr:MaoC family dehydratase N-terminal domain-containing protein [Spirochaetales bacterium]
MAISKDLAGKKLPSYSYTVERGKVREFCLAIGEQNPIYTDPVAARAAGFEDTPVPPTFQTTFVFWGWGFENFWKDLSGLGIDTSRLLHMKEEYTYLRPIYPGTVIKAEGEISDVKTGKMDMVTFKTVYSDDRGPCIEAEMAIVMRPEGK